MSRAAKQKVQRLAVSIHLFLELYWTNLFASLQTTLGPFIREKIRRVLSKMRLK